MILLMVPKHTSPAVEKSLLICKIKFSSAQEPSLPVPQPNNQSQFYSAPMSDPIMGVGKPRMKCQTFCYCQTKYFPIIMSQAKVIDI